VAVLSSQDLEDIRVEVSNSAGTAVVTSEADMDLAAQALEDWWTDGQTVTPTSSADAAIDTATTGTLVTEERAALKAHWLQHRADRDAGAL